MIETAIHRELSFHRSGNRSDEGETSLRAARGIAHAMGLSAGLWGLIATVWCLALAQ